MLSTTSRDIALGSTPGKWDLDLSSGTFKFTSGIEGVAQAVKYRIQLHRGELFWDLEQGFPYFARPGVPDSEAVLGQRNAETRAQLEYTNIILSVEGVKSLDQISVSIVGRTLNVSWSITVGFDDLQTTTISGSTVITR